MGVMQRVCGDEPGSVSPPVVAALLLAVVSFAVHARAGANGFVSYDDDLYVTSNAVVQRGLTAEGAKAAFTNRWTANWHPLTWLSHMTDVELFGLEPAGHHLVSAGLHAAATALLLLALVALTNRLGPSLFAAASFGLHPLHVESVAWVAERKDVLAALFGCAALLAYAGWARRRSVTAYVLVTLLLALGLMAKQMLVTLPFLFLLLDAWPLGRLVPRWRAAVLEKLPWIALCAGAAALAVAHQSARGAVKDVEGIPLRSRLANAAVSCVAYLADAAWPSGLACFYPHPALFPGGAAGWTAGAVAAAAALVVATALALALRRSQPWLAVGWLWYLGMLVPVIGLVQIGDQARADRYTYLPLVGVFLALGFAGAELARTSRAARTAVTALAAGLVLAWAGLSWRQIGLWRDSETLFEHALAVTGDNPLAHLHLAVALQRRDDLDGAERHYREALRLQPKSALGHEGLGTVLEARGRHAEAADELRLAVEASPDRASAHFNLAVAYQRLGRLEEAEREVEAALRLDPDYPAALNFRGGLVAMRGRLDEAEALFLRALELDPGLADAHRNLEVLYSRTNRPEKAREHKERAAALHRRRPRRPRRGNEWKRGPRA